MINENTYTEVFEILSYMDKMTVMKIPVELLKFIRDNRNENYNMKNISEETKHFLAWLDVNYWMDEEKKNRLIEANYKKHISFYNSEKTFKKINNKKTQPISNNTSITEYKESVIIKIINKLKKLFRNY